MIERKIVQQKIREYMVESYVSSSLTRVGHSHTTLSRSPLGEKVTIYASRPGLVVGNKGSNIKKLTKILKAKFKLENPQVEIEEVKDINLDPRLIAEYIASSLERYGTARFKGIGYKTLENSMRAGALGIEILISGKIPSSRAKRWRFYAGYLKKCGDLSIEGVNVAYDIAKLKTGVVGIQVRVMPPGIELPDHIKVSAPITKIGEAKGKDDVKEDVTEVAKKESESLEKGAKKASSKKETAKSSNDATKDSVAPEKPQEKESVEKEAVVAEKTETVESAETKETVVEEKSSEKETESKTEKDPEVKA
ncbi:MAG: 30S ribosomal protein S3 [Candidatus Woesearchaeota archaeon]